MPVEVGTALAVLVTFEVAEILTMLTSTVVAVIDEVPSMETRAFDVAVMLSAVGGVRFDIAVRVTLLPDKVALVSVICALLERSVSVS